MSCTCRARTDWFAAMSRSRNKGLFALQNIFCLRRATLPVKFLCLPLVPHYPLRDTSSWGGVSHLGFFFVVRLSRKIGLSRCRAPRVKDFLHSKKFSACGGLLPVKFSCRALVAHYPLRDSAIKKQQPRSTPPPFHLIRGRT